MTTHSPTDADQVAELVQTAAAKGQRLDLVGGGTRRHLGRRVSKAAPVDLSRLSGVVTFEPEELILIARPGTRLVEVERLLGDHGQHLAFEPPRWDPAATLGGTLGCGWAGPRRFRAGAVRDFVLGVELVDGRGRRVRAGGRVVKNVTGYDLWRTSVGAYGTLGAITEVCFRLLPRPEAGRSLVVSGLDRQAALTHMLTWARRPEEITGLAYDGHRLVARVEGSSTAVDAQLEHLRQDGGAPPGACELLSASASASLWAELRDAVPYRPRPGETLWRLAVPPAAALDVISGLESLALVRYGLDWGGGLVWASLPGTASAPAVHEVARRAAGTAARLADGPDDANAHAFTPLSPGVERLNQTLKRALDPAGILNPGRMAPEAA